MCVCSKGLDYLFLTYTAHMTFLTILRLLKKEWVFNTFNTVGFHFSLKLVFELCYPEILSLEYELSKRIKPEVGICLELNMSVPEYP